MVTSVTSSGLGTVTLGKEVSRSSAGRGNNMGYSSIFGNGSILVGGSLLTGAGRLARPVGVDHVHGGHGECGADIASVSSRLLMGSSVAVSGAVIVSRHQTRSMSSGQQHQGPDQLQQVNQQGVGQQQPQAAGAAVTTRLIEGYLRQNQNPQWAELNQFARYALLFGMLPKDSKKCAEWRMRAKCGDHLNKRRQSAHMPVKFDYAAIPMLEAALMVNRFVETLEDNIVMKWHLKLAHLNEAAMKKMVKDGMTDGLDRLTLRGIHSSVLHVKKRRTRRCLLSTSKGNVPLSVEHA
ncbi:hypothetical protein PR003_g26349 [Phytophthora rubi]|uniref:GAG-pre-integrase domain-containing protein n=1 Tax=Phytophthora rubi TaxID=129364 RepID=A0A6A4CGB3_9STRA|nr:hypothetical protein PR003_g26349 [Phytophthora rubi]